jgi:cytochrome c peroxidase
MRTTVTLSFLIIVSILFVSSCSDKDQGITPKPYTLNTSTTSLNKQSELGRVLFYDAHLSVNNSISCASCHKQAFGFSDNVAHSRGFQNAETGRNSPPIQNLASVSDLFWDGRETDLTNMVLKPVFNHVEMGMTDADAMVDRVRNLPYYAELFTAANGSPEVTAIKIAEAIRSFVLNFNSGSTRFDAEEHGFLNFTALETQGKQLFFTKYECNSCHQVTSVSGYGIPTANGGGFLNIGLDVNYTDNGRANFTGNPADIGKFKIPSLRNVALTAPYMHDGRFATLEEVIEHYSHGIQNHPNLDPRLKGTDGNAMRLNITDTEKQALVAFLNTLTDYSMVTNRDFASPFH